MNLIIWNELNERQRHYLTAIYQIDQEKERYHKSAYARGELHAPKASVWRWMQYHPRLADKSRLQIAIGEKHIDQGTGSTFEALERRGLIQTKGSMVGMMALLEIRLTTKGRAVARAGLGVKSNSRPKGSFSKGVWAALKDAYEAGEEGYHETRWWRWRTAWLWLRNHDVILIRELGGDVYQITDAGRAHYERFLEMHQALYPELYQERS